MSYDDESPKHVAFLACTCQQITYAFKLRFNYYSQKHLQLFMSDEFVMVWAVKIKKKKIVSSVKRQNYNILCVIIKDYRFIFFQKISHPRMSLSVMIMETTTKKKTISSPYQQQKLNINWEHNQYLIFNVSSIAFEKQLKLF